MLTLAAIVALVPILALLNWRLDRSRRASERDRAFTERTGRDPRTFMKVTLSLIVLVINVLE